MKVKVTVFADYNAMIAAIVRGNWNGMIADYVMNHDNDDERRTLGAQCRNAFEGGQVVMTFPVP